MLFANTIVKEWKCFDELYFYFHKTVSPAWLPPWSFSMIMHFLDQAFSFQSAEKFCTLEGRIQLAQCMSITGKKWSQGAWKYLFLLLSFQCFSKVMQITSISKDLVSISKLNILSWSLEIHASKNEAFALKFISIPCLQMHNAMQRFLWKQGLIPQESHDELLSMTKDQYGSYSTAQISSDTSSKCGFHMFWFIFLS